MNQEQVTGFLRIAVPFACAWLAAKGIPVFGDATVVSYVVQIAAAGIGLTSTIMSVMAHTNAAKLKSAAAVGGDDPVKISVPASVIKADSNVAALVKNTDVPNVVALKPGL
jgi:hypothetical protein